ncbi:S9 family peptidase [Longimicrobium sp.]|uniref:S9 family peptidase n=1 Tax=Longimicrobium sp. TaxID=2029185 RepID=UPI002E322140|nr:S9 family peptidase [Longimicrobium sp.]HEX6037798.1 S9 family peptidase [Longimicrobium sp.]
MRIRPTHLLALAGLVMAAGAAQAQARTPERRPLTALDFYHLKNAGGVTLSPDGQRAVFIVTEVDSAENRYRRDLWIANTDGSGIRRLTWTNARGIGGASFSPDGRMLAFTQSRQGQGTQGSQVWILPLAEGGEAWPLTEMETGAFAPVWSPDSRRMAFLSSLTPRQIAGADTTRPRVDAEAIRHIDDDRAAALAAIRARLAASAREQDPRVVTRLNYLGETSIEDEEYAQIYVVDVRAGAKPVQITKQAYDIGAPAWTPSGDSLLFSASPPREGVHPDYELESDLRMVAADGSGRPRVIARPGYAEEGPAFSPDGRWIVFTRSISNPDSASATNSELMMMRRDGSGARSITATLDRTPNDYVITPDGWLYFTVASEGAVPLYRTRLDAVDVRPVVQGPRGVLSFDVAGGRIAWSEMNPRIPSDVYTADAAGAGERRLTMLNDSLLARVYVSDYHEMRYPSFDGRQAHAWYLMPIGYRPGQRPPLAVQIHGGPHSMWGPGEASMWLEYQMLAGAGYTVFLSNPRGSQGYGNEGLRAIQRDWGTSPARDILIGADSVIARGLADPDRQVVTGGSYAGYMTAWLIAREAPARFKAAVAARGVYDLGIWYYSSNTWRLFEGEFGTRPWEDPEVTRAQSPITYVANIRTPLLMLHADTDFRATIASAEAMYRAMKVLGKEVEFVRYPREGHELTRSGEPNHRIDHMLRTLEFFERYITH